MEDVRMETKNNDGVRIEKPVPFELVSQYEAIGWERVKKDSKENKDNKEKEENKSSQNSLNK